MITNSPMTIAPPKTPTKDPVDRLRYSTTSEWNSSPWSTVYYNKFRSRQRSPACNDTTSVYFNGHGDPISPSNDSFCNNTDTTDNRHEADHNNAASTSPHDNRPAENTTVHFSDTTIDTIYPTEREHKNTNHARDNQWH